MLRLCLLLSPMARPPSPFPPLVPICNVPSAVDAKGEELERSHAMHRLLHATSLDADSAQLSLFERGVDGGFVAVKAQGLPLTVAICRMVCVCVLVSAFLH
jgi:hypothetical protein